MNSRPLFRKRRTIGRTVVLTAFALLFMGGLYLRTVWSDQRAILPALTKADTAKQEVVSPVMDKLSNESAIETAAAPASELHAMTSAVSQGPSQEMSVKLSEFELQQSLQQWRQAWSSRNIEMYLDQYSPEFKPQDGRSRSEWVKMRSGRISGKKHIQIDLKDIDIDLLEETAVIRFTQMYTDESVKTVNRKKMVWFKYDGRWLIQKEMTE